MATIMGLRSIGTAGIDTTTATIVISAIGNKQMRITDRLARE
jgi:hypothetical protein